MPKLSFLATTSQRFGILTHWPVLVTCQRPRSPRVAVALAVENQKTFYLSTKCARPTSSRASSSNVKLSIVVATIINIPYLQTLWTPSF